MRGMKRVLAVLVFSLVARSATACSCVGTESVADAFKSADAIFAGVVESIEDPFGDKLKAMSEADRMVAQRDYMNPERGRKVTFRVMQWWKGDLLEKSLTVWTGYGGGDCGYPVEKGQSFLVYARRNLQNRLTMAICGRTSALVCALGELEALGQPIAVHERFDRETLIRREQPYTMYSRPCIAPALLVGERGLMMNKHCSFLTEGKIDREGVVRDFRITRRPTIAPCPPSLDAHVLERVAAWRFKPATIEGVPVEVKLTRVAHGEPSTESEYAAFLQEAKERLSKMQSKEKP